jgi:hypothetical protein
MLYDPKWEIQTKPDVFSLESLIAWLEKQPAGRKYDWYDINSCMVCQYLDDVCAKPDHPGSDDFPRVHSLDKVFIDPDEYHAVGLYGSWTFGAALSRARAALAAR